MSKNVLVLSGSPRKSGNSDLLCNQLVLGAKEVGNKVEKIFLSEKKIGYCRGCYACESSGRCVQKDDMEDILEKIVNSDVIVMASPVYFYTIDAQIKTLIDRTVARYTEINNKEFYFIVTAAVNNKKLLERTIECFRGFIDCLEGAEEKGVIYGTGAWQKGDIKNKKEMKEAYDMGKTI
ncbi:flavodoxin family protein [Bacillus sp. BAU-SS-2023]|nr:flavodoxin family protein [Bacillus sp. BAU-SS-2023]